MTAGLMEDRDSYWCGPVNLVTILKSNRSNVVGFISSLDGFFFLFFYFMFLLKRLFFND